MLKKVLSIFLVLFFILSVFGPLQRAQADASALATNKIDPGVQSQLGNLSSGESLTVIVTLRQQADLSAPGLQNQQAIIGILQANAHVSQRAITAVLEAGRGQGRVSQVIPFWIFNGLSVTATADMIQELAARDDVRSITPDAIDILPVGNPSLGAPASNLTAINAPALWSLGYSGQGVVVANLDSGVDKTNPDLAASWRGGSNSWYDPYGQLSSPGDLSGHGTWTMGVMVARDASGSTLGVAPQAQWIAARIFNNTGSATATAIHQAFQWVLDPDGNPGTADAPNVVNNSWSFGGPGCNLEFQNDLLALRAAGILPVFAAGNYGSAANTSVSPANNPGALAVGAVNNTGFVYSGSSRGPSACGEASATFPEIVAPGVLVGTTDLFGLYTQQTGTSLSAPHAAGAAALLLSAFPGLSAENQEAALINTAVDLGDAGPDNTYGYGMMDALAAYNWLAAGNSVTPTPLPTSTTTPLPTNTPVATNTPTSPINLALNKAVSVSSFQDSSSNGSKAVDGNYGTFWKTARASGKNKPPTEWITVDLGTSTAIEQVVLDWDAYYATNYSIQVSANNTTWNTVYNTSAGNGGNDTLIFTQISARYVKLLTTGWSSGSQRNWLQEIEIYAGGSGQAEPTPTVTATAVIPPSPTPTAVTPPSPTPTATTPPSGGGGSIHIGDLDGTSASVNRRNWSASVTIYVHDVNENPVSGVTVTGAWSSGVSGATSCTTDAAGSCVITSSNINTKITSAVFSVLDISAFGYTYTSASNHDPDGDSSGTSIPILSP